MEEQILIVCNCDYCNYLRQPIPYKPMSYEEMFDELEKRGGEYGTT